MNAISKPLIPAPLEKEIHATIVKECHKHLPDGCVWFHVPNSGKRSGKKIGWLKQAGVKAGVCDLWFFYRGCVLPMELKTEKGALSPAQVKVHERLADAGFPPVVVRSAEEAMTVIRQFIRDAWKP